MKIRSDFVTNSSSSSFIVVFNNKKEMEAAYKEMEKKWPFYASQVFDDIKKSKVTYGEVIKYLREMLYWKEKYYLKYTHPVYSKKDIDWYYTDEGRKEIEKVAKERAEERLEEFKNSVNHRGFFAYVEYCDHTSEGSELEHYVMPKMPFVKEIIDNH